MSTNPFLDSAICLYEAFGFRRVNDGTHDLFGPPLFTMEKTVALAIEQERCNPNLSDTAGERFAYTDCSISAEFQVEPI